MNPDIVARLVSLGPFLVFALLLLVVIIVVWLWILLRRSRVEPAQQPAKETKGAQEAKPDGEASARGLSRLWLRQSFMNGLTLLRANVTGRDYRYEIPWFLVVGACGSGKSTMMNHIGARRSFGTSGRGTRTHLGIQWRFFDRGVLVGAPGLAFLESDGLGSDISRWRQLLHLLLSHRARRPIDGVVVTIPASDLIGPTALDNAEISLRAAQFREKLTEAVKVMGLTFPVYILVTKCDLIPGFRSFSQELPFGARDDIFGWSNPNTVETVFALNWIDQAISEISGELLRTQGDIFVCRTEIREQDKLFLFPDQFAKLRDPLRACVGEFFRETAYQESFRFRGIYFCGDLAEPDSQVGAEPQPPELAWFPKENLPPAPATEPAPMKPIFLRRLFEEKIFAENALARPLSHAFLTRNRTAIAAQIAAALLFLILSIGTWVEYRRLTRDERPLMTFLQDLSESERSRSELNPHHHDLVPAMANAGDVKFKTAFLPSSLFSSTDSNITSVMINALNDHVFKMFRDHLHQKGKDLLSEASSGTGGTNQPDLSIESMPEFADLERYAKNLRVFAQNVQIYNDLSKPGSGVIKQVQGLMQYLFNIDLRVVEHGDHFNTAVTKARGAEYKVSESERSDLTKHLLDLHERFYDAWYVHSILIDYVADVEQRAHAAESPTIPYEDLKTLAQSMRDLQGILENRTLAVITSATIDSNPSLLRTTNDPDPQQPFLESHVIERVRDMSAVKIVTLRADLEGRRTAVTGPIVDFDGGNTIELSSGTRDVQTALENLLNLSFMSRQPTGIFRDHLDASTRLLWRNQPLIEAQGLLDTYSRFVDEGLGKYPAPLRSAFSRIAKDRLNKNVQDLVLQAQDFSPQAPPADNDSSDVSELASFRDAVDPLTGIAKKWNDIGYTDNGKKLIGLLDTQALNLLARLDQALQTENSYGVKDNTFQWWTGSAPLSLAAYQTKTPDDLSELLATERESIQTLSKDADPVIQYLDTWMPQRSDTQDRLIRKWRRISDDLKKYQAKKPGTPVAALEEFILTDMDKVRPETGCPLGAGREIPGTNEDYFLQRRNNLRHSVQTRCQALAVNNTDVSYNQIGDLFNRTLAPFFPFNPAVQDEADLAAVIAFYALTDRTEKSVRDSLQQTPNLGTAKDQALKFLDQMDKARPIVAPAATDTSKDPSPLIDFLPVFRADQTAESGGNELTDWTLQIGQDAFRYRETPHPARWRYGSPIRLSLRWAKDSPAVPSPVSAPGLRVEGRSAVFDIGGKWALLRLIHQREAAIADFKSAADFKPSVLKFNLQMDPDTTWTRAGEAPPPKELKIFIQLLSPDGKFALILPPLPSAAPELTAGPTGENRE